MRSAIFLLLLCYCHIYAQSTTQDRDIAIKITPYQNCFVYLASYYGNTKIMADTAWLDSKSEGHFRGARRLTGGLYFVVSPRNKILFEFLLNKDQHFAMSLDTAKPDNVIFTGSPDNEQFSEYLHGATEKAMELYALNKELSSARYKTDSLRISGRLIALGKALEAHKDSIIQKYPGSLTALFLTVGKQAEMPEGFVHKTRADTMAIARYFKQHYWDDIPFNDDRLLYMPFFEQKIDRYFQSFVSPAADSVIPELYYILNYARTGKEMYPYLLMKFTSRYMNPEHIGQNKVFLDLFQNYYLAGDTILLNGSSKKMIFDRAYQLMANEAGDPAPPLDMTDNNGQVVPLYSITAPYTFVVFWDPGCSHCREQVPRIDSMYRAKWKAAGVKLYSVNIKNTQMKELMQFAREKNLSPDWIHTSQPDAAAKAIAEKGQPNYHQLYDVYETPTTYLLDKDKHIIAKKLTIEQFDAVLAQRKKNTH